MLCNFLRVKELHRPYLIGFYERCHNSFESFTYFVVYYSDS